MSFSLLVAAAPLGALAQGAGAGSSGGSSGGAASGAASSSSSSGGTSRGPGTSGQGVSGASSSSGKGTTQSHSVRPFDKGAAHAPTQQAPRSGGTGAGNGTGTGAGTGAGTAAPSAGTGVGTGQQLNPVNLPQNEPLNSTGGRGESGAAAPGGEGSIWSAPGTGTTSGAGSNGANPAGTGANTSAGGAANGNANTSGGGAGIGNANPSGGASGGTSGGSNAQAAPTPGGGRTGGESPNVPGGAPVVGSPMLQGFITVNQVLNEALIKSPRAAAVRALLPIQTAAYAAATMMPDPVIYRDEAPISEQVLRFGAQKTWDPPWKLAFRFLAARRQVQEQKLELLNTLWTFRNDVRRAYTEVVIAQETYDTLSALADLANRLLSVSQKLFRAGSVAELDVLKAQLAASQAEVDRDQGGARVALAKQQLNIIMGRHPDSTLLVARLPEYRIKAEKTGLLPNLSKAVPPVNEFMELALSNRLELRILKAQIALAESQLRNSIANIAPDPVVASGYSSNNNGPSGPKIKAFFTTMNFEFPLFTYSQGDIVRLRATIRQYHSQILSQRNQITSDVTTAYNHLIIARRRIAAYQEHILADSAHVARLARRSYEVGQSDITSTLAAQQANVQVRQNYLEAVNNYQQAFTELEQAIGVPLI